MAPSRSDNSGVPFDTSDIESPSGYRPGKSSGTVSESVSRTSQSPVSTGRDARIQGDRGRGRAFGLLPHAGDGPHSIPHGGRLTHCHSSPLSGAQFLNACQVLVGAACPFLGGQTAVVPAHQGPAVGYVDMPVSRLLRRRPSAEDDTNLALEQAVEPDGSGQPPAVPDHVPVSRWMQIS